MSPALIQTLMETEPSEAWIQPVDDLEKALVAIRSGPKVASRKDLEDVVENLRIRVSGEISTLIAAFQADIASEQTGHVCPSRLLD